jgi:hypothetical protein
MVFDLDKAIEDEEEFQKELLGILARSETRLKAYRLSRSFMRGESPPQEGEPPLTIPAAAELILRKHGSLHVREIAKYLEDYSIAAVPTTITTSLARYAQKGKVFKRLGGNRFGLIGAK